MIRIVLGVLLLSLPATAEPSGYALVVANNRSLDPSHADLRYADDDGVQYAQLFAELVGPGRVTLLAAPDEATVALSPAWSASARAPTLEALDAAVDGLARALAADAAAGRATTVWLVFAGHGDVDEGQGYLELADARLTARDLEERVVARLPAQRLHLVLDSCQSYFLLNARRPGGRRWETRGEDAAGLLERYPNVGAVVATSSEAVTWEWDELQSGVFSYEVRSGLRGAADADGDGQVTYDELAAFLEVANQAVPNELFRPRVFAAAPRADPSGGLVTLPRSGRTLALGPGARRRLTVRDADGVRLLDVHKEAGDALRLALPPGALVAYETVTGEGGRPAVVARDLPGDGGETVALEALPGLPPQLAARGSGAVFRGVFAAPFGREAFADWRGRASVRLASLPPFVVSRLDARRLQTHLVASAAAARDERLGTAFAGLAVGAVSGVAGWLAGSLDGAPSQPAAARAVLLGAGLFAATRGALALALRSPVEDLAEEFVAAAASPGARLAAVPAMERRLRDEALRGAERRRTAFWATLVSAAGVAGLGACTYALVPERGARTLSLAGIVLAVVGAGFAVYDRLAGESPVERAWRLYRDEATDDLRLSLDLSPAANGAAVGVSGTF